MWTSAALSLLLILSTTVLSKPSASSVGSDLHFLLNNDLDWPTAGEHNGTIFLSNPQSNQQALASCRKLNEQLLSTDGKHYASDTKSLIQYLSYSDRVSPNQRFWVAGGKRSTCQSFSLPAGLEAVPCTLRLPTLCSQSAPYRSNSRTDPNPAYHLEVRAGQLTVLGTRDHLSFRFIGIPFAQPFKRFEYSKPFAPSEPTKVSALSYGSACLQGSSGSEDCLFLNIYTPFIPKNVETARTNEKLKPVLFWIHGGGFTGGQASDAVYDGGNMASRSDVVVVSINYRLGALGFLALNNTTVKGNYGIADQITGLEWVKKHIAAFGGDPSLVTIYGQSAGAGSVRALLGSPPAFGLFAGAIAQSNLGGFGYAAPYTHYLSLEEEHNKYGQPLVENVGCGKSPDVVECLRALPASTLIRAPNAPRYIVTDGRYITNGHLAVNGKGPTASAHVIFGWTRDDGSDFIGSFPNEQSTIVSVLVGAGLSAEVANKVEERPDLFPIPTSANSTLNIYNVTSRVGTDGQFLCIDQATVVSAARHGTFPSVWAYQFDRTYRGYEPVPGTCNPPPSPEFPNGDPKAPYFRCHSGELYYTAGSLGQDSLPFRDVGDLVLSQTTVDAWGSFARTFNPNPDPAYLAARGYRSSAEALKRAGTWHPVLRGSRAEKGTPLRIIDYPGIRNSGWRELAQCELLQYPLTMFE